MTYLAKFCPQLSEKTKALRDLVKNGVDFCWETAQANAFQNVKDMVSNAPVLALFDPSKEVVVNVDASSHSLGAVLLQGGRPVEYAAQVLTPTQCIYAQIEKELLAIQFGLTRFHQYVYGRAVVVESDHQPLVRISTKPLNELTPRLQRMKMRMQHYDYTVVHVPGKEMYMSDYLSRACEKKASVLNLDLDDPMPQVCDVVIRSASSVQTYCELTDRDDALKVVVSYTRTGWPKQKRLCHALAKPYWQFRDHISEYDGLLFYGERLIVPSVKRSELLDMLHSSHQGITKTQQRARSTLFWPGMNVQIDDKVSSCAVCRKHDNAQKHAPLMPSEIPEYPWQIIGSDIFQVHDTHYLLNVDYYSKWVNVSRLSDLSSRSVIQEFEKQFAEFGDARVIRSDNGAQYNSREFREFVNGHSIKHATSSPGFPRSNGQAERAIQTVKRLIIKANEDGKCFWKSLQMLRNTPLDHDMPSPAQLLQGRTLFDGIPTQSHHLFPRAYDRDLVRSKLISRQNAMKSNHDTSVGAEKPVLSPGQSVHFRSLKGKWVPAVVEDQVKERSYMVRNSETGIAVRRNRQQIKPYVAEKVSDTKPSLDSGSTSPTHETAVEGENLGSSSLARSGRVVVAVQGAPGCEMGATPEVRTRCGRVVRKPSRFRE